MQEQIELFKVHRQQQEKLVYYIVALCVTSIGFSIYQTTGHSLKWIQVPLALAVLSWGLSIYCGLRFLKYALSILYANNALFNICQGIEPGVGNHPHQIKAASSGVEEAIKQSAETSNKLFKWQERLFYSGIVLFLFWHLLEMRASSL